MYDAAMSSAPSGPKPWYKSGTLWIFVALVLGVVLGGSLPADTHPHWADFFGFLSHAFIGLIKGLIVPLLLSTIVVGIAQTGDLKAVGRMGGKALLYFEIVTTIALVIGLAVVNLTKPGDGLTLNTAKHGAETSAKTSDEHVKLSTSEGKGFIYVDGKIIAEGNFAGDLPSGTHKIKATRDGYLTVEDELVVEDGKPATKTLALKRKTLSGWDIALHGLPTNLVKHAADGDILPIVVFATIFAMALTSIKGRGKAVLTFFDSVAQTMFKYTDYIMYLTPLGVFGSMASNVSHMAASHGSSTGGGWPAVFQLLSRYAMLVGSLYLALVALAVVVFIPVMLMFKIPILGFVRAIKDPVLTAFSTASSEAALPTLLEKLIEFGVPRRVAGFVVPAGYSFNLDGSTLYLVLGSMTIAQAAHVELTVAQQLMMLVTLVLTSKGVAGVPRATLVIISATADGFGLPGEAGIAMLLAVDEVMDMARTATNVTGNALASVVIAKWEGVFGTESAVEEEAPVASGPAAAEASAAQ
jgi:Na+/H+-dicarboxylate symporter